MCRGAGLLVIEKRVEGEKKEITMAAEEWPLKTVTYREEFSFALREIASLLDEARCTDELNEVLDQLDFLAKDFRQRLHAPKPSIEERIARTRGLLEMTRDKLARPGGGKP